MNFNLTNFCFHPAKDARSRDIVRLDARLFNDEQATSPAVTLRGIRYTGGALYPAQTRLSHVYWDHWLWSDDFRQRIVLELKDMAEWKGLSAKQKRLLEHTLTINK